MSSLWDSLDAQFNTIIASTTPPKAPQPLAMEPIEDAPAPSPSIGNE